MFGGWNGACSGSRPTCTITMNSDKTVSADFLIADPCPPVCQQANISMFHTEPRGELIRSPV
jgi:hypothetical protein